MLFTVFIPLHRIGMMVCNYYSILPELDLTDFFFFYGCFPQKLEQNIRISTASR